MQTYPAICRLILIAMLTLLAAGGCKRKENAMPDSPVDTNSEPLDPAVTRELFLKWRAPRIGTTNPERMNNPVWQWLIKSKLNAYQATQRLSGPSAMDAGPGWCFDRFGQSSTQLPDGRELLIAGEHEDSYDPDFYIYNDVVVRHPDGSVDIFGYPRAVFPPTDFHSATLIDQRVLLVGNLGYSDQRKPGATPVFSIDLKTFTIAPVQTSGASPGWIHGHKATLSDDGRSILVQGGKVDRGGKDKSLVENIDDWRLQIAGWRWERLTERRWSRWELRRKDGELNHLFDYQQAVWAKEFPEFEKPGSELARLKKELEIPSLKQQLGKTPDLDLFTRRYAPPIPHEKLGSPEDEPSTRRIRVEGVVVRYVEEMDSVQMTVEGELPQNTLDTLTKDLLDKLTALENTPCELIKL